jgi:hypothetical protein
VESSFDRELRLFFGPIADDRRERRCAGGDGNQRIGPGRSEYDRSVWPVDVAADCPLENVTVEVTGFEVRAFDIDDESVRFSARIPASFTVNPELANLVIIGGAYHRVLSACSTEPAPAVGAENLLLEAESPLAEHAIVSFQWWGRSAAAGYVVQLGVRGEVLEGEVETFDATSVEGVFSGAGTVAATSDADRSEPISIVHAYRRPTEPCPQVVHHLAAETELDDVTGRTVYGVLQACPLREANGVELLLAGGGTLLFVVPGDGPQLVLIGRDGLQWPSRVNTTEVSREGDAFSGDVLLSRSGAAAPQRVRFDLDLSELPCHSP